MTHREKASMFFESLLDTIENIDNIDIREKALKGLLRQTEFQLTVIEQLINQTGVSTNGNSN